MKKPSTPKTPGRSRSRRPKTGTYKSILVALTTDERLLIEAAAAQENASVSQFMARQSFRAAKRILSKPARDGKP